MSTDSELIVGLDIGTTKMCAVVGEVQPDSIEIIGIGSHPSEGLRKGVVINIEKAAEHTGLDLGNCTYAVHGFGNVGGVAAMELAAPGVPPYSRLESQFSPSWK